MRVGSKVAVWGALVLAACGTTTFGLSGNDAGTVDAHGRDATQTENDTGSGEDAGADQDAIAEATAPRDVNSGRDAVADAGSDVVRLPDGCAFFCDDFDKDPVGALPTAAWVPAPDASSSVVVSAAESKSPPSSALASIAAAAGATQPTTVSAIHTANLLGQAGNGLAFDLDFYLDPGVGSLFAKPTGTILAVAIGTTVYGIVVSPISNSAESYSLVQVVGKVVTNLATLNSAAFPNMTWIHARFLATPGSLAVSLLPTGKSASTTTCDASTMGFAAPKLGSPTATISIGLTDVTATGTLKVYYDNVVIGLP